jgi:hypothetical protein
MTIFQKLEPLNKVAGVDHLYKGLAVAPKGLAYATPSDAAARTKKGLRCGYKLGAEREKTRGNKQETPSCEP